MHVYVPDTRPATPAIVVAMRCCHGTGPGCTGPRMQLWHGTADTVVHSRYGDKVEAYTIQGAGHTVPSAGLAAVAIEFFGLTGRRSC